MSCPEVMYQAYYPYLYQRPGATASPANVHRAAHFSHFAHQYDRFNVQRTLDQPSTSALSTESYHVAQHHSHTPSHHSSAGSVSSNGGVGSPGSPVAITLRYKEEENSSKDDRREPIVDDDDDDDAGSTSSSSRAQYLSANCVVFTHYSGDVAAVVDEHFTRALNYAAEVKNNLANSKDYSPMSSRNFPPSFWNSDYQAVSVSHASDFYGGESAYHAAMAAATNSAAADPWHTHYQQYAAHHHHRAVHDYHHHHNMAAQYSSLLIPQASRLPAHMASHQYHKSGVDHWSAGHSSHHRLHEQSSSHHALDATTSPYTSYPTMAGLEAQVQESSKDLYWF